MLNMPIKIPKPGAIFPKIIIKKTKGDKNIFLDTLKLSNKTIIKIDPYYFRPNDVQSLLGNANKLFKAIKWKPKTSFKQLVKIMVQKEIELIKNHKVY